jgi:hypothetical protein
MAKPGPRPKTKAPTGTRIDFTEEERSVLTAMGTGSVKAKIHALIQMEIDRQHPRTKSEAMSKYLLMRKKTLGEVAIMNKARGFTIEMGYTDDEVRKCEDEQDEEKI